MGKELTQSLEDYLEAIYYLEQKNRVARVKDIAEHLDVQMPSVTGAVRNLRERGLVDYEKNSYITLTASGMKAARSVYNKHRIIHTFLNKLLLVDAADAEDIACKIEHSMPPDIAAKLECLTEKLLDLKPRSKELEELLNHLDCRE